LVKLATRSIVEEGLEAESREAQGREYHEHGAAAGQGSFSEIPIEGTKGRYRGIGIGEGAVWVPDVGAEIIFKIDPTTNKVVNKITAEKRKEAVRLDEGMLGYILAMASQEARQAADEAITRA
jgi:hypothetical protein